eukprot:6043356-Pleurochrysis_carterae.AAC.2
MRARDDRGAARGVLDERAFAEVVARVLVVNALLALDHLRLARAQHAELLPPVALAQDDVVHTKDAQRTHIGDLKALGKAQLGEERD